MSETGQDIVKAVELLKEGHLVAVPTETVYGLAGDGTRMDVVAEIFRVKNRPSFDPMILHFSEWSAIAPYVREIPEMARKLASAFWPGPLTMLLFKSELVPDLVTAGSPRVAVRVPSHPMIREVLSRLPFPLAAPSANLFGYISPTNADHVLDQLGDKIPYVLDGGQCRVGLESTIVDLTARRPIILRKGGITVEEIIRVVGEVEMAPHSTSNPTAPGMLKSHYAPNIPLVLTGIDELLERYRPEEIGGLFFDTPDARLPRRNQRVMSPSGNMNEAAANLFAYMRELDKAGFKVIATRLVPDTGLGRAINDKLKRATAM